MRGNFVHLLLLTVAIPGISLRVTKVQNDHSGVVNLQNILRLAKINISALAPCESCT